MNVEEMEVEAKNENSPSDEVIEAAMKMYICKKCGFSSKKYMRYRIHLRNAHLSREMVLYKCQNCTFAAFDKSAAIIHQKNGCLNKCVKCPYCSYHTLNRMKLTEHIRSEHEEEE